MSGAGSWLRRTAYREWGALAADVRDALTRDGWRAIPMTLVAVCLVGLLDAVQQTGWGGPLVERAGVVSASLPWWTALARTPLSLFVPALDLPVWGALAQVLVIFGLAEITLGRVRTLVAGYAATLAGTLFARWALAVGVPGFSRHDAFLRDTGPSAAVVALAICVAWRYRAWWTAAAVVLATVGEALLFPDLAGWEHLVAVIAAVCCALVFRAADRRHDGVRRGGR